MNETEPHYVINPITGRVEGRGGAPLAYERTGIPNQPVALKMDPDLPVKMDYGL